MGKRYVFTAQEQALVTTCIALAQKAGSAAQKACMLGYLTQGEHEAKSLIGYAAEADNVMKKPNDDGTFELSRGAIEAIRVGVNVYGERLAKSEKADTELLLGTEDHQTRHDEAQRLVIKFSDDLFTQNEPVVEGAGKTPKKPKPAKNSKEVAVVLSSDVRDDRPMSDTRHLTLDKSTKKARALKPGKSALPSSVSVDEIPNDDDEPYKGDDTVTGEP